MRVVITGGAGFVGSHLAERLLRQGDEVVVVDNLMTGREENLAHLPSERLTFIQRDVCDGLKIDGDVDAVLHFASPASPVDYQRAPVDTLRVGSIGTLNMLEFARAKGARVVFSSTSEVYGDPLVHPQPEGYWGNVNPVGPRSMYDEAKRFSEAACVSYRQEHGVDAAIIRIFNTFGPRMRVDDGRAIPNFVAQALNGTDITVTGTGAQTRSLCYVDDLVDGVLRMMHSDVSGPINLGNPKEITMLELATWIRDLTGSSSRIVFVPRPGDDPEVRRPVIDRAWDELGWQPQIDVEIGLKNTIEWFLRQPQVMST